MQESWRINERGANGNALETWRLKMDFEKEKEAILNESDVRSKMVYTRARPALLRCEVAFDSA